MIKKRIDWIDIAKGIAIILMIIGHTIHFTSPFFIWIFSFHMPLFVILSGINYKTPSNKNDLKKNITKYIKRLFIPYLITLLICISITSIKNFNFMTIMLYFKEILKQLLWGNGCGNVFLGHNFNGVGPIWFLITLFFSKILFDCVNYYFHKHKIDDFYSFVFYCFIMLFGIFLGKTTFIPQGFDLACVFLFYLYIGYLFKREEKFIKKNEKKLFILSFLVWTYFIGMNSFIEMAVRSYPYGVLSIVEALCASYCIIVLCMLLEKFDNLKKIFSKIGKISLIILCIHSIDIVLINWSSLNLSIYVIVGIRVIGVIAVSFLYFFLKKKIINVYNKRKKHYTH